MVLCVHIQSWEAGVNPARPPPLSSRTEAAVFHWETGKEQPRYDPRARIPAIFDRLQLFFGRKNRVYHSINTNIIGFVGCLLTMTSSLSYADDKDVVVVGSHDPMKAGSSATVDIDETVSKNATFGDLLLRFPGTVVRQFGGLGDYSGLSIRGSSARQVEFFLQGIPREIGSNEIWVPSF